MREALCGTQPGDLHLECADPHRAVAPCNTKQTQTGSFFQIHHLVKGSMLLTSLPGGSCREDAAAATCWAALARSGVLHPELVSPGLMRQLVPENGKLSKLKLVVGGELFQ